MDEIPELAHSHSMETFEPNRTQKGLVMLVLAGFAVLVIAITLFSSVVIVPPGHVKVATLFGKIQGTYSEGMHLANPLNNYVSYDVREMTIKESVMIPSRDQMSTKVDISVQFRVNAKMVETALRETGQLENLKAVHLIPKLRSLSRESGKTIERAEDFFNETTQQQMQIFLLENLQAFVEPKGLIVDAVLIREMTLPPVIAKAVDRKKEREQAAEQQKAELQRFRTEQEQKVAQAEAERDASALEAEKLKLLADARAYEIEAINRAIADNPLYLQLEAMKTLAEIAKDPAAKIYFLDGSSPKPLPLMHLGETPVSR